MKILQKENKTLRQVANPVPIEKIATPDIQKVIKGMKETMHPIKDAVAIAAPQIGRLLRIFVVSECALAPPSPKPNIKDGQNNGEKSDLGRKYTDLVAINPEITNKSKKEIAIEEGCLSVRWLYGYVKRSQKVTLRAYDEHGKLFTRGASGLLAQIFQHETDHLNGVLFTDKARDIKEVKPKQES